MSKKFDPIAYAESKNVELSEADLKKIAGPFAEHPASIDRLCLCRPAKVAAPKKKAAKKEAGE